MRNLSAATRVWLAAPLPPLAWFGFEQGLGAGVRVACRAGGPPIGPLAGVAALLACAAAAALAWPQARRSVSEPHDQTRRFVAGLVVGAAALFSLAIGFQTLATLIVPPCLR